MKEQSGLPTEKDKESIAFFFNRSIVYDTYGYVLLGKKPCAITCYNRLSWNPISWVTYFSPNNLKIKRGWLTWKKYEAFFPHPDFLFFEEDSSLTSAHFIILVNKKLFLEKVSEYKVDFLHVLQTDSGEELLQSAKEKPFLREVLRNHDGLIGTVLGYGRNNAWAFQNRSVELGSFTSFEENLRIQRFFEAQGFWNFWLGTYSLDISHLLSPGFAVLRDNPETDYLRKIYLDCKKDLIQLYSGRNYLDVTLGLLSIEGGFCGKRSDSAQAQFFYRKDEIGDSNGFANDRRMVEGF